MEPTPGVSDELAALVNDRFEGTYYDGKTTKPHLAWVWVQPGGLRICKRLAEGQVDEVFWYPSGILKDEFNNHDHVVLRYDSQPPSRLEVRGQGFYKALLEAFPVARFQQNPYFFVLNKGWGAKLGIAAGVVASVYFIIALAVPFMAGQLAYNTPAEIERQVGENAYASISPLLEVNEGRSVHLQAFFNELFPDATEVKVVVVDSEVPNAFAVPGHVVVFTGLLDEIEREDQLAGLLAHEYGHIVKKHSLRSLYNDASIWLVVGAVLGDASSGTSYVLQNASGLAKLDYSRGMEREADTYAIGALKKRNLNPRGMAELFEILQDASGESALEVPTFLSTHPGLDERIEKAQAAAEDQPASAPSAKLTEAFGALQASAETEVTEEPSGETPSTEAVPAPDN
ncbi:MAG: M48 family metallopeptidase [Bacteroidia bacterium]|nr:M48 family metallopeptidase [Bacteroidia bacterium]